MAEDGKLFLMILTFLAVWTGIIGVVNLSSSGQISMGDFAALSGPVPGQLSPDLGSYQVGLGNESLAVTGQDYTNSSQWSVAVTGSSGAIAAGECTQTDGIGFVCTKVFGYLPFQPAQLFIRDVSPVNGVYDIKYTIENPSTTEPFYTEVYALSLDVIGVPTGYYIKYDNSGLHLMNLGVFGMGSPLQNIGFTNANHVTDIETKYNPGAGTCEVLMNGVSAGTFNNIPAPTGTGITFGGVGTYGSGLVVKAAYGSFNVNKAYTTNNGDWISAIINFLLSMINAALSFATLIGAAIGLSGSSVLPVGIWAVLGIPCIATLIYLGFKLWRGT